MPAGKLSVSPLTIHGLAQNGFPTSQTFVGCYVSPSEKQRTNSASGPEPHFQDTLTCQVNEQDQTLNLDVINEDPARPGPIGSAQVPLYTVFESRKFEDWIPLTTAAGGPLGHIYMKLSFEPSSTHEQQAASPYGLPPPPPVPTSLPPSYNEEHGQAEERKIEVPHTPDHGQPTRQDSTSSFGPESPMPAQYGMGQAPYFPPQQPVRYNSQTSMPGGDSQLPPPVYTPPVAGVPPPVATPEPVATPSPVVVDTPKPVAVDTPAPVVPPKKKGVPDWMKYGGAALAGAAAVGLGSWVKSSFDSDEEEEEEARKKAAYEQHQRAMEEEPYRSESFHDGPPPEQYHREYVPEQEAFVHAQEREEEEEAQEEEAEEEEEEEREEEEEEREEEEEEREEEEEEAAEEAEEEESDRPIINDTKWR